MSVKFQSIEIRKQLDELNIPPIPEPKKGKEQEILPKFQDGFRVSDPSQKENEQPNVGSTKHYVSKRENQGLAKKQGSKKKQSVRFSIDCL